MAPNFSNSNGDGKRNDTEDQDQPSETTSLLAPAVNVQVIPSTPTLGTSLSTPWRHHQGSAPASPLIARRPHVSGAISLSTSPMTHSKHRNRSRSKSPNPSIRRSIRWIGVNGARDRHHHHHHPLSSSSIEVGSPHHRPDRTSQTPHIIVSPECETQEPFFIYPEIDGPHDLQSEKNNEERLQSNNSADISSKEEAPESDFGNFSSDDKNYSMGPPEFALKVDLDSRNEDPSKPLESDLPKRGNKPSGYIQYSAESSSSNSPVEERNTSFFGNELSAVEQGNIEYPSRCNTLPHSKTDNNLSLSSLRRNYSMLSLDASDPFDRKTRRSSMRDMLRRVSSNNSLSPHPNLLRTASSVSFATINNHSNWKQDMNSLPVMLNIQRSTSMVSLCPSEIHMRKTRKASIMEGVRRASYNSNPENRNPLEKTTSKISLVTIIPTGEWKEQMNDSLILCVSALYAKLLVVMGMAFPIAEIISSDVPLLFYNSFYLYLYFGSIFFLIYAYIFLLRTRTISANGIKNQMQSIRTKMPRFEVDWSAAPLPKALKNTFCRRKKEPDLRAEKDDKISVATSAYKPPKYTITETNNHGSMYLKMGAVLFGIGSMIYSGLEFGQYFELRSGAECANILMAISPIARMIFTFLQMYFIFLNSRVAISKHTTVARFGFMHMIGTNLCIWLNVLVQETKHEIAHLTYSADQHHADLFPGHSVESHTKEHSVIGGDHSMEEPMHSHEILTPLDTHSFANSLYNKSDAHNIVRRSVTVPDGLDTCRRINLMGNVVNSASPFLFPCTIEYSLLCAGVLYVMWKNTNNLSANKGEKNAVDGDSDISTFIARKVRHHYSVDCARASRGLFTGIFILVLTIISLILFYVLITNESFKRIAILEANIIELSIYSLAILSVIVGMKQMRELEFILEGDIELDNILLIIAQAGVYIYASFTIIGGYFSLQPSHTLPLLTAILSLIQTTLQTLFILDGSRRCCSTADQLDRKPGREMVTFLLVCNLAMWAISTFETSRADVHPTQLHFYGIWAWTIISHVSMPLAIFYRFHVTVCLGEIWKRSYKLKQEFIGL